jgi:general secretion pathway protein M
MIALSRESVLPGRIAAVALLLVAIACATAAVALPIAKAFRDYDASIANLRTQVARYDAMERMRAPLQARLSRITTQRPAGEELLGGGSTAVAGAQLQDLIKRHVAEGGGTFVSAQSLPAEDEASFERIGLRVQFTTTVEGLVRSMHAIESGRPLLIVENLDVRARAVRKGEEFDRTRPVVLAVTVDVAGFRRREKS